VGGGIADLAVFVHGPLGSKYHSGPNLLPLRRFRSISAKY
jgi:hypothetical protein